MTAAADRGVPAAPIGSPFVLRRPRLEERLDELFGRRLALVVAGAGFGKSTLLATWSEELESAWYTITPRDRALASFAAGVGEALLPHVHALPDDFRGGLSSGREESSRAEALAGALASAVAGSLSHDIV